MSKVMVIDLAICNGCHNCQIACKDEHVGNDWSPIAKPQPDTGQFWHKVENIERGTVPKVQVTYHHSICQHCEEAPCIAACSAHAIYRRPDGIVIIDPEKCRGNRMCIAACPYEHVIYFNDDLNIAQKCTFCAHLLDQGWTETRCSDACPTGAITFGEEADLQALIAQSQPLKPDLSTRPRVYYRNLPKKWIAGAVYDPDADECIEGATVTATLAAAATPAGAATLASAAAGTGATVGVAIPAAPGAPAGAAPGAQHTAVTDNYGDFWLKGLEDSTYTLSIEKPGYKSLDLGVIDATERDQNLGDIALRKR